MAPEARPGEDELAWSNQGRAYLENTRHEFQTWRRSLYELSQLLFL